MKIKKCHTIFESVHLLHGVNSNFCTRFSLLNYCNTIEYLKNISCIYLLAFMVFIWLAEVKSFAIAEVVTKGVEMYWVICQVLVSKELSQILSENFFFVCVFKIIWKIMIRFNSKIHVKELCCLSHMCHSSILL